MANNAKCKEPHKPPIVTMVGKSQVTYFVKFFNAPDLIGGC